ncbi:hypothetical protein PAPYR_13353 [Paratrimastix pyriformis]|uniref:RING-type domain-containing protein n=1 Tax=Paratrimastix pyriformis TaxID=342808 RepID=A0ABQ8U586_9EUKA|nr:hypothetical protein PAPYR_13353 [Paratrimastix pyriformis]
MTCVVWQGSERPRNSRFDTSIHFRLDELMEPTTPSPHLDPTFWDDSWLVPSAQVETLSCQICYRVLREPVSLPCTHTFCKQCLQDWLSKYEHEPAKMQCPMRCEGSLAHFKPVVHILIKQATLCLRARCPKCHAILTKEELLEHYPSCIPPAATSPREESPREDSPKEKSPFLVDIPPPRPPIPASALSVAAAAAAAARAKSHSYPAVATTPARPEKRRPVQQIRDLLNAALKISGPPPPPPATSTAGPPPPPPPAAAPHPSATAAAIRGASPPRHSSSSDEGNSDAGEATQAKRDRKRAERAERRARREEREHQRREKEQERDRVKEAERTQLREEKELRKREKLRLKRLAQMATGVGPM